MNKLEQVTARAPAGAADSSQNESRFKINDLLDAATHRQASDLIITVEAPPTMRVLEDLVPIGNVKLTSADCRALLFEMLSEDLGAKFERMGEVDFAYSVPGLGRYRVNGFRQRGSTGIVIRIIPARIQTVAELGLPNVVASLARRPNGIILVTGPTGSGKTTTLAAMIDLINSERPCHILTLEDPIEYLHRHKKSIINQREIGNDTRTYANGLRAALRENPDVILVGELRDLETISTAMTAAETGHLVLSTLHTCDAAQTIDRVIDVFPPHQQDQIRVQLSGTIQGVLAQQLVMRADGQGRVAAFEILVATPAIRHLIREGKTYQIPTQLQTGARYGMKTLEGSLRELVIDGVITDEECRRRLQHLAETGAYTNLQGEGHPDLRAGAGSGQGGQAVGAGRDYTPGLKGAPAGAAAPTGARWNGGAAPGPEEGLPGGPLPGRGNPSGLRNGPQGGHNGGPAGGRKKRF